MKHNPAHIAQALVEASMEVPADQMAREVDSALTMLRHGGPYKSVRAFPRVVQRMLRRKGQLLNTVLYTPTGDAGAEAKQIEKILKDVLNRDIMLDQVAKPDMIGGAVLLVGDERFDMSIPGALEQLRTHLTSKHLPVFPLPSHESQ